MSVLRQISRGLAALVHSRRDDAELAEEIQHYLDETTIAHERRGMSHAEARRLAAIEIGGSTHVHEQIRSAGWEHRFETLVGDVHFALRRLRRSPGFTITAVATLALGIGASTAVFSAIEPVLIEPLPFPHASRLVTIDDRNDAGVPMPATFGSFTEVRARARSFETLAAADDWQPSLVGSGEPERLKGQRVTADYFATFGVSPAVGRAFSAEDEQPVAPRLAILSDGLVKRRFAGDHSILGRTIELDGDVYTVVGIMPRGFANIIAPSTDVWTAMRDRATGDFNTREWGHHYKLIARLSPTSTVASAMRELVDIGHHPISAFPRPRWAELTNGLLVRSMQDDVTGPVRPSLLAIIGAVVLLLTIAAVNVANLLLARGAQRRSEFAMRVALGASRGRIVRQLLTESVVLALAGGAIGLIVAQLGVRALVAVSPPGLPRVEAVHMNATVFVFALILTGIVGVIVGFVPALAAARAEATGGLHHVARPSAGGRAAVRSLLVIAEVALAVVLLVGAGLLYRSVTRLLTVPAGFDASHVVTLQVVAAGHAFDSDTTRLQFYQQALDEVRHVPGVESAAFTSQLPLSGDVDGYGYEAQSIASSANGAMGSALRYSVSPEYFAAMRIPLRQGRLIDATDRMVSPQAVVINESMARALFGNRNPIGERMRFGPELGGNHTWHIVVGVVGDVKHYSLAADAPDAFYVASGQWNWVDRVQTLLVRVQGDPSAIVPSVKRAVWTINRNQPIQRVRTMESFVSASAGARRFALLVIETFAIVAIVLASVGLYGVIAGGVAERIREIGIRSALGAAPADIVLTVVGRAMALVGAGLAIGLGASLGATRAIQTMLFGVSRVDPVTYVGVIGVLGVVAAMAAWAPARRAAGIDPTVALRTE